MEKLKRKIEDLLLPKLEEENLFLVDIIISANFKIQIFADGVDPSITIAQCQKLSRFIEKHLDEDPNVPEKYGLEFSSPGMSNPLKIAQQFQKRIGSTLKITLNDGQKVALLLKEVQENTLVGLRTKIQGKSKRPVKKIKEEDLEPIAIDLKDIKQALLHFKF